ncbi:hypothetical protein HPB50_021760 [Hyalomma asiaticum]|uniref:Uncharacterized protein n=1 Tax=Hyalomma asiaticum TaxID=266040 RepID=A0ACB7S2H2_HYAAI|nr:hypothetical protein HPB50_021760 [Hyalomma asiaticum]
MNAAIPPPPFLQCPGVPPIPWRQWRPVLQVYIDAAARDATPEHKKALLLNALGYEGLNRFLRAVDEEQQPGADRETPDDAYNATLDLLERVFNPSQHPACVRTQFKFLRQRPDETAVEFSTSAEASQVMRIRSGGRVSRIRPDSYGHFLPAPTTCIFQDGE